MPRRSAGGLALTAAVGLAACGPASSPAPRPERGARAPSTQAARAELGREWFALYCAACHGPDARGGGPVAANLRTAPPDLTRIAERHGRFDREAVGAYVDGREPVEPHGTRDMPVWGRSLPDRMGRPGVTEPMLPREILDAILEHLRSVQTQRES